jgi:hypothetical protein
MDLLNRYLHAVGFWLPKPQQDDIIAELSEDLRSQIEDRAAALGHSLDDDGIAAILTERGHPMLVAGSYLPQRSLIGPALFPAYQFVLKLVILWILTPIFILMVGPATVLSSGNPFLGLAETAWTLLLAAVFSMGIITAIFSILERYPHESTFQWNPRRLPAVAPAQASQPPKIVSRFNAIVEVLAGLFASLLWIGLMWSPHTLRVNGIVIAPTPVWRSFFWPILLVTLSSPAAGLFTLLRPRWMRTRACVALGAHAVVLILLSALSNMGPWVRVVAPGVSIAGVANANHWTNVSLSIGFAFAFIGTLVAAVGEARLLARLNPAQAPGPVTVRR